VPLPPSFPDQIEISCLPPARAWLLSTSAAGLPGRRRRGGGDPPRTFSDSWFCCLGCPSLLACFFFCGNFSSLWTLKSKSPFLGWRWIARLVADLLVRFGVTKLVFSFPKTRFSRGSAEPPCPRGNPPLIVYPVRSLVIIAVFSRRWPKEKRS
jgi:hypothetical protein